MDERAASLRHRTECLLPKQKRKVVDSAAYDTALRQRSSLAVWFTDETVAA